MLPNSCFFALVFGILWPTSEKGNQRPQLSAYRNAGTRAAKAAAAAEKKD